MYTTNEGHKTFIKDSISSIVESFIFERRSQELAKGTILYYQRETGWFLQWLNKTYSGLTKIQEITPDIIRTYLADLGTHRNKGGIHASYRAIKALLYFYESEYEPDNWKNPIKKVKIQNNKIKPLPGIKLEDFDKLLNAVGVKGKTAIRDRAILQCLIDSGCRATEFLDLNVGDVDLVSGAVRITHGKGDKARTTFFGREARKALRKYMNTKIDLREDAPLWMNESEERRLTISGLRHMVQKYALVTGIKVPGLHDFRRCFGITLFRNGVEVLMISQLLGHTSVEITKRYLDLNDDDLRMAHMKGNPLDNKR